VMQTISVVASSVALAVCAAPLVVPDKLSRAIGIYQGSDWRFYRGTSALLAVLAAAGIVWNTAMTFVIPACLSLR